MNSEMNENDLENIYGGPIKVEDLPKKFKEVQPKEDETELSESQLENIYGGPLKPDQLPDNYYTDENEEIMGR